MKRVAIALIIVSAARFIAPAILRIKGALAAGAVILFLAPIIAMIRGFLRFSSTIPARRRAIVSFEFP
jgi:hypothetical protein